MIAGPAGGGIKSAGLLLQKILRLNGYYTFGYTEYPSLIRGGDNTYQIDFAKTPINSSETKLDLLVALNENSYNLHIKSLNTARPAAGGAIALIEEELYKTTDPNTKPIPITQILTDNKLPPILENTIYIGVCCGILGVDLENVKAIVKDTYEKFVDENILAIEKGYEVGKTIESPFTIETSQNGANDSQVATANEAVAQSFIDAKGGFFTSYPMTPATSILHNLADKGPKKGVIVKQAASEIEAIGLCAGASYAGKRSMTATSGGGFALMTEFVSLLGGAEIPLVIVDSQRPAPATGLPTQTEQGDLLFAIHAGHGDFPKIVLAPGDPEEAYFLMADALNLAEKYQVPVIFLLDKHLSESSFTIPKYNISKITIEKETKPTDPKTPFKRYSLDTETGISPRTVPGEPNGMYICNSDEHDEFGYSIEGGEIRSKIMEKRMKKLETIATALPPPKIYGEPDAETLIICWGSTKGVILDSMAALNESGKKVKFMQIQYLWPFPSQFVQAETANAKKLILVENNYSAQLGTLLEQAGVKIDQTITKYNGQPFFKDKLIEKLNANG